MDTALLVRNVLEEVLPAHGHAMALSTHQRLLDAFPDLDSMAAVSIITLLEERMGFVIEPGELDGTVFETLGSLVEFVESKLRDAA